MTIQELCAQLSLAMRTVPEAAHMQITFGQDRQPVAGGIYGHNPSNGQPELNLSPVALDQVGGF